MDRPKRIFHRRSAGVDLDISFANFAAIRPLTERIHLPLSPAARAQLFSRRWLQHHRRQRRREERQAEQQRNRPAMPPRHRQVPRSIQASLRRIYRQDEEDREDLEELMEHFGVVTSVDINYEGRTFLDAVLGSWRSRRDALLAREWMMDEAFWAETGARWEAAERRREGQAMTVFERWGGERESNGRTWFFGGGE